MVRLTPGGADLEPIPKGELIAGLTLKLGSN